MNELLDIVDANDRVIGCATRAEIHRTARIHRAVHMLVSDGAGQVYLQKRAATKDINPHRWDSSAAGHVDSGEEYIVAAVRELEEELGLALGANSFCEFLVRQPSFDNGFEHQRYYAIKISVGQMLTPCPREIADSQWLSFEAVDAWVGNDDDSLTPDLKQVWPVYRAYVG